MAIHFGKLLSNIKLGFNYFLETSNPAYSSKASTRQRKSFNVLDSNNPIR